uniref:Uncharacterized protein n=1 Tax=Glossina palpalis gambiensis TaxID=67801 RepID=A0A1B0B3W1_9MUSC
MRKVTNVLQIYFTLAGRKVDFFFSKSIVISKKKKKKKKKNHKLFIFFKIVIAELLFDNGKIDLILFSFKSLKVTSQMK